MAFEAPLFIIGAPRSGTTLFYKSLCLHPHAAWLSNWVVRASPAFSVLNRIPRRFGALQDRAWFDESGNAYVYGRPRSLLARAVPTPVEGEPVFARAGLTERGGSDPSALRRVVGRTMRWGGGTTFVSKRIGHNRRIAALLEAFPDARFLHVVRDGRDVARSLEKVDWWETSVVTWYGGTPAEWRAAGGDPVELCARTWVEEVRAVEAGLRDVPQSQQMVSRFEDALANPAGVLGEAARFAGLPADPAWSARVEARLASPRRAPVEGVDPLTRQIEAIQRAELEAFGYTRA